MRKPVFLLLMCLFVLCYFCVGCGQGGASNSPAPNNGGTAKGALTVTSTPSGAAIYLNNVSQNKLTPNTIASVDAGSYTLKLVKTGYLSWESSITISGGATTSVTAILTAETSPSTPDAFSVFFINVGQGDSILIKTNQNRYVLIDSGPSDASNYLNSFLNSKGVTSISMAILTHPNADHYGEFKDVVGNYTIGAFLYTNYPSSNSTYASLMSKLATYSVPTIEVNDPLTLYLDNLTFNFFHPPAGFINTSSDENDNSLAIKISNQAGTDFLDCGDLETAGINSLLSRHNGDINVELLKVDHHGSSTGTTQSFLNATTPTDAFICVGASNPYGHPSSGTITLLQNNGIDVFRTDLNGNITVTVEGTSYTVTTQN